MIFMGYVISMLKYQVRISSGIWIKSTERQKYQRHGELHRIDGPAYISKRLVEYWLFGKSIKHYEPKIPS